jgi:hypothetical protein
MGKTLSSDAKESQLWIPNPIWQAGWTGTRCKERQTKGWVKGRGAKETASAGITPSAGLPLAFLGCFF